MDNLETKIGEIAKEVLNVSAVAGTLVIKDENDVVTATEFLASIKARITRVEDLRTFFVKPLNDQVRAINAKFKEQSEPLDKAFNAVKRAVADYRMAEEAKARKEEARLKALQDAKNDRRAEKGKELDLSIVSVERADTVVATDTGKTVANKVWTYRVKSIDEVPRGYLRCEVKHSEIMQAIKNGERSIAGLEIYEDFDVRVSAK